MQKLNTKNLSTFHKCILSWYEKNGRKELPWRDKSANNRAYRVLISEIMLQQTQVKSVLEKHYFPFLQKFPTLKALSKASEEEVLNAWVGLGYYTRARNLFKLSQITQNLPCEKNELLKLPGIGAYSAGAVACFGFDKAVSFVDSNIKRLLCRIFALYNPSQKILEQKAEFILNKQEPFSHNQALLDLGALICTSKKAKCESCPISSFCQGKENPLNFPLKKQNLKENKDLFLGIFIKDSKIALEKSQNKLYFNLYNFPLLEKKEAKFLGALKHNYTKYNLNLHIFLLKDSKKLSKNIEFFTKDSLKKLPTSTMTLKVLNFLEKQDIF